MAFRDAARACGLDCGEGLSWDGSEWAPGGEYIKRLRITNVSPATLHLTYTVPKAKVFFMNFPEEIVLSAGNSIALEVSFRPIASVALEDAIHITTPKGSFAVPVCAHLPRLSVLVTPEVDFGMVPVNEATTASVVISNTGQVDAPFVWTACSPFSIQPAQGSVPAGKVTTVTLSVLPGHAAVIQSMLCVTFCAGELESSVRVRALAKYQQIRVASAVVDVGNVLAAPEEEVSAECAVHNVGPVRATVSVASLAAASPAHFTVLPPSRLVPAGESASFRVVYRAHTAGLHSCERFKLSTPGGNAVEVTCRGATTGPTVSIARKERAGGPPAKRPYTLQFGDLKIGSSMTHVVVLSNASRQPAAFAFQCTPGSVFDISEVSGIVPAQLSKQVLITFKPLVPANYYRRVVCLIASGNALYLDLMGTAYDDKHRPFPLRQRHVDAYRLRAWPLKLASPETVLAHAQAGLPLTDEAQTRAEAEWSLTQVRAPSGDRSRAGNAVFAHQFIDCTDARALPVTLSTSQLQFGQVSLFRPAEKQTVVVYNHTATKVTAQWVVPPSHTAQPAVSAAPASAYVSNVVKDWSIVPEVVDIEPGSFAECKVAFRPTAESLAFCQELELFVAPKANRSFRLVDEESFTPPVCLTLQCAGNTFRAGESFTPRLTTSFGGPYSDQLLYLPPAMVGDAVYYTFHLTNSSDVPAAFAFNVSSNMDASSSGASPFSFRPAYGSVATGGIALVTVRFAPQYARMYSATATLCVNDAPLDAMRIRLVANGCMPRIAFPTGGAQLFIKPTEVGNRSSRTLSLRNLSPVPVHVRCSAVRGGATGDVDAPELIVQPADAVIEGNDSTTVTVSFHPVKVGAITCRLRCDAHALSAAAIAREELGDADSAANAALAAPLKQPLHTLQHVVSCDAVGSAIHFQPAFMDMGATAVHSTVTRSFYLVNSSDSALNFSLDAVIQAQTTAFEVDAAALMRQLQGSLLAAPIGDEDYLYLRDALPLPTAASHAGGVTSSAARHATLLPGGTAPCSSFTHTLAVGVQSSGGLALIRNSDMHSDATPVQLVTFEPASGVVHPRSRVSVFMKFTPVLPTTYRLRLFCNLQPMSEGAASSAVRALPPLAHASKVAALEAAILAERDARDPATVDWSREPVNDNYMWCDTVVAGCYPSLQVEDAFQLTSREALLSLFPQHMAGFHNKFLPLSDNDYAAMAMHGTDAAEAVMAASDRGRTRTEQQQSVLQPLTAPPSDSLPHVTTIAGRATVIPKDLWLRGNGVVAEQVRVGAGASQEVEWGGWSFSMDDSVLLPASPWQLWSQFSLADVNRCWASRLSAAEEAFNATPPAQRNTRHLPSFCVDFTPAPLGSPPMVVLLHLRNASRVVAQLDFTLQSELDIEVEPWVDLPDVSAQDDAAYELLHRRVFDIQPRSVRLAPGEAATVRMHYAYARLSPAGGHHMQVLAQLQGGKPVVLNLRGSTLSRSASSLFTPFPTGRVHLGAAPIGAHAPFMHRLPVINPSAQRVRYVLDAASLEALQVTEHGARVFSMACTYGELAPFSSGMLRIAFQPLEAKEYEIRLRLVYETVTSGMAAAASPHAHEAEGDPWSSPSAAAAPGLLSTPAGVLELVITARGFAPTRTGFPAAALTPLPVPIAALPVVRPAPLAPGWRQQHVHDLLTAPAGDGAATLAAAVSWGSWGKNMSREAIADALFALSGVDTATAAVSTFYNPLHVLLVAASAQATAAAGALPSAASTGAAAAPLPVLLSGMDAGAASVALQQLATVHQVCVALASPLADTRSVGKARGAGVDGSDASSAPSRIHALVPGTARSPAGAPAPAAAAKSAGSDSDVQALVPHLSTPSTLAALFPGFTAPPRYHGAVPPLHRFLHFAHVDMPEGMASLSCEWLRFGAMPAGGISHLVAVLRNDRGRGAHGVLDVTAQLDAPDAGALLYQWDATHPAVVSGMVRIHPMAGRIAFGEVSLVRFTFAAPQEPQTCDFDVGCTVRVPEEEYTARTQRNLQHLLQQREAFRRAKFRMKPGSDAPHMSVANKVTVSRAMHLQEVAQASTLGVLKARPPLGVTKTMSPSVRAKAVAATRPAVLSAAGKAIASSSGSRNGSAPSSQGSRLLTAVPQTVEAVPSSFSNVDDMADEEPAVMAMGGAGDARMLLASVLAGDMNVDESMLVVDDSRSNALADIRPNMSVVPLPPAPAAMLWAHLSATVYSMPDFVSLYSAAHAAAFFLPRCASLVEDILAASSAGSPAMLALPSDLAPAVHDILSSLLADVAREATSTALDDDGAASSLALLAAGVPAPAPSVSGNRDVTFQQLASSCDDDVVPDLLVGGLGSLSAAIFTSSNDPNGTASGPPLLMPPPPAAAGESGVVGGGGAAYAAAAGAATPKDLARSVYMVGLAPPRATDARLETNVALCRLIRDDAGCSDFLERMLESTVLNITRELLAEDTLLPSAAGAHSAVQPLVGESEGEELDLEDATFSSLDAEEAERAAALRADRMSRPVPKYMAGAEDDD